MSGSAFQLTVLGARGSMAGDREDCAIFGGDTSCYQLEAGDETFFLDAGTGLLRAPAYYPKPPVILLSHLHLDHLAGLGMFPGISNPHQRPRVYVPFCQTKEAAVQTMDRLFSPPFWPLRLQECESAPELYRFLSEFDAYCIGEKVDLEEYADNIDRFKEAFMTDYAAGLDDGSVKDVGDAELFYYSTAHATISLCKKLALEGNLIRQDVRGDKAAEVKTLIGIILASLRA